MRTGRPLTLDELFDRRPILDRHGQPTGEYRDITRSDRILELVGAGYFVERAARAAGVPTSTFYSWTAQAAKDTTRRAHGARLTRNEARLVDFLEAVEQAEARWEASQWLLLERASQGTVQETVTEKIDPQTGTVVERTVVRKQVEAKLPATFWRLRQRFPDRYKEQVQVTGPDGGPILVTDDGVAALLREADAYTQGAAEAHGPNGTHRANGNGSRRAGT